jgi:NADPH:quinone reductase-like Zn-dependent oxidoreductase
MKAYEIQDAFGLDALRLVERPDPEPGPHQVLVRLRAVALNYRDLLMVRGQYNPRLVRPRIPTSDGAGEVIGVGPNVTRVRVGERVMVIFAQKWIEGPLDEAKARSDLGGTHDGVLAEFGVFHEEGLMPVPAHLGFEEGSTLPCAAVTAWNALIEGGLKPGEDVLVQGTGGVSIFALQFARLAGARVIATSSSDKKLERVRQMGAAEGINYKSTPDWDKRVRAVTGGRGVDHIVEVGGAGTLPLSLRAVRTGGHIALIGVLAGAGEANPLPAVMKHVRLRGIYIGSREMFEAMNRAIVLHGLRPVIDRLFPFADAVAALRYLESGAHIGKVVIQF